MAKKSGNRFTRTSLRNGGRAAGMGIAEDDYSEESFGRIRMEERPLVRFSTDRINPESLNGPVIIIQEGRKKND